MSNHWVTTNALALFYFCVTVVSTLGVNIYIIKHVLITTAATFFSYSMARLVLDDFRRKMNAKQTMEKITCAICQTRGRDTNQGKYSITSMMV